MSKKLKFALLLTFIAGVAIFLSGKYIIRSFQEPIDMYSEDFEISSDYLGKRIEGEVPFSAGQCSTLTETTTRNGIKTGSKTTYYYAIPVNGANPDYYYYISIEVNKKSKSDFDNLTLNLYNGTYGNYKVEGTLEKLDDEAYNYMLDYFVDANPDMTRSELKEYVLPYYFKQENYGNVYITIILNVIATGAAIILWVLYILACKNTKKAIQYTQGIHTVPTQVPIQYSNVISNDISDTTNNYATNYSNSPTNEAFTTTMDTVLPANESILPAAESVLPATDDSSDEKIYINSLPYPKSSFDVVNQLINNDERINAIMKLREITNVSLAEANSIIDNWNSYYKN